MRRSATGPGSDRPREEGLRQIVDQAPLILFAIDPDARLLFAAGGGRRTPLPQPLVGQSLREVFAGTPIGDGVERALRGERFVHRVELDGTHQEVHYAPWPTPDGRGAVGLVVDVTERERALRALRESDERLRIISDHASEMIIEQGPDTTFAFVSRSFAEMLGYTPEELVGRRGLEITHPDDAREVLPRILEALGRGEPARSMARLRRRDGSWRWGAATTQSFLTDDGERHTVSVIRDVTEEREREARRERQLERLEHASAIGSELIACPAGRLESRIRTAVAEAGRLAGADRAMLVLLAGPEGTPQSFWWSGDPAESARAPDTGQVVSLAHDGVLQSGRIVHVPDLRALREPDSHDLYLGGRGNLSLLAFPLQVGERSAGFLAFTRTRRALAWDDDEIEVLRALSETLAAALVRLAGERELERRHALQREITAFSRRLIGMGDESLDPEIRAGLSLAARIARLESALVVATDPRDRRFLELHQHHAAPDSPTLSVANLESVSWLTDPLLRREVVALPDRAAFPPAAEGTRGAGGRPLEALLAVPIEVTSGFVAYLSGWTTQPIEPWSETDLSRFRMVGDLLAGAIRRRQTERLVRESEAQLAQSQKLEAVGRLAGHIAHDFNNLLTVIAGNADVMVQDLATSSEREDVIEIRRAADRAAELTRDLLAFSRGHPAALESVALNDVVRGVTALLERTLGDDIELDLRLGRDVGRVQVESDRLRQIVVNLALNGREAMPGGGRLCLDTRAMRLSAREAERLGASGPGRYALLEVADEGEGMDANVRERVFEPFFTTKRSRTAVGLGLSIAYSTLREIGGAVEIESRRGAGTTVRLYMPTTPDEGAATAEA